MPRSFALTAAAFMGLVVAAILFTGAVAVSERLPVAAAKDGFSVSEVRDFVKRATVRGLMAGGPISLWWTTNVAKKMPTAIVPRRTETMPLANAPMPEIGNITAKTSFGDMTLDAWMNDPRSFAQGFIIIHRGQIVYEAYPGLKPDDAHMWASTAKPLASLIIDKLIDKGLLDERKTIGDYMPDFRGTAWEPITIKDILDMTTGLNAEENPATRRDPNSITSRLFYAELGEPNPTTSKMETVREVLKDAKPVRPAGMSFDYGSGITQALVLLAEEVSGKTFSDLFDDLVWSKVGSSGPIQLHLAPDGTAAVHGFVSSSLRDMARFGMLYTPSWNTVATERVVTPEIVERIRKGVRPNAFYMAGVEGPILANALSDAILSNSRQWDAVFPDGDFYKSGFMAQGLYVSPGRDLVIAYFSTSLDHTSPQRFLRPIATSGLFGR